MRTGCFMIVLVLVGLTSYGLYISWGFEVVILFLALVAGGIMYLFYRQKKQDLLSGEEPKQVEQPLVKEESTPQLSLQDPDLLLKQFRAAHTDDTTEKSASSSSERSFSNLQLDEEAAFNKAVEELKNVEYADDSIRMQWIRLLENYTKIAMERLQSSRESPFDKRIIALFISRSFVYCRVFVNLLDISVKMERIDETYSEQLEARLVALSESDYERVSRVIALHLLDLFLSDHVTTLLFDDQFTRRRFTQVVMNGLQFSEADTNRLASLKTDTEVMQLLLSEFQLDAENKLLIDLAKTAFENMIDPLKEAITDEVRNMGSGK